MQAAVHARLVTGGHRPLHSPAIDWSSLGRGLRWVLPQAHDAIRRREHTKSQLVEVAHRFKRGFRLGALLERPRASSPMRTWLGFFAMEELSAFVASPQAAAVDRARAPRGAALPATV
ncbi:MAG: hypothetical protein R3E50_06175 [Halioglobus sp.]